MRCICAGVRPLFPLPTCVASRHALLRPPSFVRFWFVVCGSLLACTRRRSGCVKRGRVQHSVVSFSGLRRNEGGHKGCRARQAPDCGFHRQAIHGGSPIAGGQNGLLQTSYESCIQNGRIPGGGCRRRPRQQAHADPAQRSCIRGISYRQLFRVCRWFQ